MVWKRSTNTTDTGDAVKFGTRDINKIVDYLDNVDVADPVTIATTTTYNSGKLNTPNIVNTGTLTLPTATTTLVGRDTTDTLTNKTLTAPVISSISNTGTVTLPTATDTLVGKATTDTLTNKTLTSPVVNSGTLNTPTIGDGTNVVLGTVTGSKIGTASTQKLSFFGATPIVQPAANPDTSSGVVATVEAEVNQIKQLLRDLGLMAP